MLVPDVHDRSNAVTRFVEVGPAGSLPAPTGSDRTSVAAFLGEDHAGALMEILTEFAVRGINLSTIQSRPTGDGLGSYFFFIDCEGHIDDARVGEAMMGVRTGLRRGPVPRQLPAQRPGADPGPPGHVRCGVRRRSRVAGPAELRPALAAPGGRVELAVGLGREQVRQSKVGA